MVVTRRLAAALLGGSMLFLAACGSGGGTSGPVSIVFATQGLGAEGDASKKAVADFNKANPGIHVSILTLSPTANNAYQQLTQRFIAGSDTPDVITSDVIWPATFAKSGWILPLDRFHLNTGDFFAGQLKSGTYQGKLYAVPWFINAEGVYYRTDLVSSPPTSPQQLVQEAKAVMSSNPSIKTGFAFEGAKYEGVVTAFLNVLGGFGGSLDPSKIDSPENVQALTYLKNLIYQDHVSPPAVTSWQESNVQDQWLSGQAAFAMNWPYIFQLSEKAGSAVQGKTGWIPFPSSTGTPMSALGGDDLVINARSKHPDAAWKFIQYLTSPSVQIQRAIGAGDPPAVKSAYTQQLYSQAPYYRQEQAVFNVVEPRPVSPVYPQISEVLQTQLNAALTNQTSPEQALAAAQQQINGIVHGSGG
ncbi:MAG TPA: ABC transporter substrate-binding protein [Candidatus Dormibacteraeota bacterium]|nr:ABC transporter substrate-binding protein [Candidatus Dormibacteraeota bacterium]